MVKTSSEPIPAQSSSICLCFPQLRIKGEMMCTRNHFCKYLNSLNLDSLVLPHHLEVLVMSPTFFNMVAFSLSPIDINSFSRILNGSQYVSQLPYSHFLLDVGIFSTSKCSQIVLQVDTPGVLLQNSSKLNKATFNCATMAFDSK